MNRRGFLRILAALPVIRHIPLPKKLFGDGDSTLHLESGSCSAAHWKQYQELNLNGWKLGDGGGGAGGWGQRMFIIFPEGGEIKVTANGGRGSRCCCGALPHGSTTCCCGQH